MENNKNEKIIEKTENMPINSTNSRRNRDIKKEKKEDEIGKKNFLELVEKAGKVETKEDIIEMIYEYDKYLIKYPESISCYVNRANLLQQLGWYDLAMEDLDYALEKVPNLPLAWCGKAFLYNLFGNYKEGWKAYEWRWETPVASPKEEEMPIPRWKGEEIGDNVLLIYAEQGLGDNIQFVRFVIEAHIRGFNIMVANHKEVEDFVGENLEKMGIKVTYNGDTVGDIHCYTSMMSLPFFLGTTLETVPFSDKYLSVNKGYEKKWERILGPKKKYRVGIVWAGSPKHARDKFRSIPFNIFSKLFELDSEKIEFHSLQLIISEEDRDKCKNYNNLFLWDDKIDNFSDTSGLVSQMDLVITIDSSVSHLCGAIGKKTWILLTYHPDFRWLLDREDSPWYKSFKLFRQNRDMEWNSVIENVKNKLKEEIEI